jgi:polysaccharide export outer membrane protein
MCLTFKKSLLISILVFVSCLLQGCSGFFSSSGASRAQVESAADPETRDSPISVISVNNGVALKVLNAYRSIKFNDVLPVAKSPENLVGLGDSLDILVWEAPPAILFTSSSSSSAMLTSNALSTSGKSSNVNISPASLGMPMTALPPQVVNKQGTVIFPFIGRIQVAGKTLTKIEKEIVEKLAGKANQPQVMVRLVTNYASTVTVVGEVNSSVLMPLTPKGERLLDAIAIAGGVKAPVNKMTIQVTRNGQTQSLPMETVIQDPRQNIPLLPGDVVTAYYQPLSFTVLGATGKNDEITFEAQGIMLSQALARVGGLSNSLADSKGIFIFRYEDPKTLDIKVSAAQSQFPKDQVPVIYQFDLNDPGTFFASQNFPMKNKDMVYVATASSVELLKFLAIISSVLSPAAAVNSGVLSGL